MAQSAALPKNSYWSAWILAARPWTLPAAVVPVVVGTAVAGPALPRPLSFLAALIAALLIQIGTNFANDLFDFKKGADTTARVGPQRVSLGGLISPRQVVVATILTFALAALLGVYLAAVTGWLIIVIGALSIICGVAYTGGPFPLGYHGLGDVFVFLFFGLVAVVGSAYVQLVALSPLAVAAAVPVGFLAVAILIVNNVRDIDTDRAAGKRTLAVRIGRRATRIQYAVIVLGAYCVPLALGLSGGLGGWFWLPWLTLPLAVALVRTVVRASDGPTLNRALQRTGQLHLLFGLLLAASMVL